MTPDKLAKSGTEHGTQRGLFQWIRWAEAYGFEAAWDDESYGEGLERYLSDTACQDWDMQQRGKSPVPELRWCHSIPNGGLRDKITAGKMKQEGALSGVLDIHLPLPIVGKFAGLYVEMKREETLKAGTRKALIVDRARGSTSDVQDEFISYARRVGYAVSVCFDWKSAARDIQSYIELRRSVQGVLTT